MTRKPQSCIDIERDLIAAATGEAGVGGDPAGAGPHAAPARPARATSSDTRPSSSRWRPGAGQCPRGTVARVRRARRRRPGGSAPASAHRSRVRLPLGPLLIARSEEGVSLIEYLSDARAGCARAWPSRRDWSRSRTAPRSRPCTGTARIPDGARTRLDWPLDLRLARSDSQREVLHATAAMPYGAVTSYMGIAGEIGHPSAVRAVAQALRHNPVPIIVPCHRIVGVRGDLTGYAGSRLGLKERLLGRRGRAHGARHRVAARRAAGPLPLRPERRAPVLPPTCGAIARRPIGPVTLFASREQAQARGLVPCTDCRPDLHPISR